MHFEWLVNELLVGGAITALYFAYNAGRKAALKQHNIQGE